MDDSQSGLRFRVFVDFWNFELAVKNQYGSDYSVDWKKLPHELIAQAFQHVSSDASQSAVFQGMGVYLSYAPSGDRDKGLKNWASNVLDRFPGTSVTMVERRRVKGHPKCPDCHEPVKDCPSCGHDMRGTHEKGVDTRIATDMIRLAWENAYDVAILASADADFVPVVDFLDTKNKKTINVSVNRQGHHLAKKCWASIKFSDCAEAVRLRLRP